MKRKKRLQRAPEKRLIPKALGRKGIGEQLISSALTALDSCPDLQVNERSGWIIKSWKNELRALREVCKITNERREQAGVKSRTRLAGKLNEPVETKRIKPSKLLFRYLIARSSRCRCSRHLKQSACREYGRRQPLYDHLLGELVPKRLRFGVGTEKYMRNEADTALGDSVAYWHLLWSADTAPQGLPTNIPSLDAKIGGLAELTLLAAPTAAGKTSLAIELTARVLETSPDVCILFIELEVSKTQIMHKFLSRQSGVPYRTLTTSAAFRDADLKARLQEAQDYLNQKIYPRLRIVDRLSDQHQGAISVDILLQLIQQLLIKTSAARCLVVLDSFDRTVPACATGHSGDRAEAHEIMGDASDAARMEILLATQRRTRSAWAPNGFPFLIITRTRKSIAEDRTLTLSDVFGTVDLVYDAHCVLLLQRKPQPKAPGITAVSLDVAKVRDLGQTGVVPLDFHFDITTFTTPTESTETPRSSLTSHRSPRRAGRK